MDNIKDIVTGVIDKMSAQGPQRYHRLQEFWDEIRPAKADGHTRMVGLKDDRLLIVVDSSAWLYQMNMNKDAYLKKFQGSFPGIKGVFFKIGRVNG